MAGTLTTEPQRELVAAADQAYLIIAVSYWPCAGTGDRYTHGYIRIAIFRDNARGFRSLWRTEVG